MAKAIFSEPSDAQLIYNNMQKNILTKMSWNCTFMDVHVRVSQTLYRDIVIFKQHAVREASSKKSLKIR